jgi:hypothetical protein
MLPIPIYARECEIAGLLVFLHKPYSSNSKQHFSFCIVFRPQHHAFSLFTTSPIPTTENCVQSLVLAKATLRKALC